MNAVTQLAQAFEIAAKANTKDQRRESVRKLYLNYVSEVALLFSATTEEKILIVNPIFPSISFYESFFRHPFFFIRR